jgi:LAO/AO transport system kinase
MFLSLLLIAGAGDELQGIKRGIMEMADIIVMNKGPMAINIQRSQMAMGEVSRALHLFQEKEIKVGYNGVSLVRALNGSGVAELWNAILALSTTYPPKRFFLISIEAAKTLPGFTNIYTNRC